MRFEKESYNVSIIDETALKYHNLSEHMFGILSAFGKRLGNLEQTILPVYGATEKLQKCQHSLEATLTHLEIVLSHYGVSQELCNIIHHGPTEGNAKFFIATLCKLQKAMEYFLHHNSQSVELENVTSLFNTGCQALNNHYRMLMTKYSSTLKPVEFLEVIYNENISMSDDLLLSHKLPQSVCEELAIISHWLQQNLRREYMIFYAKERGDVVYRSLKILRDHQKYNSWGSETLKQRQSGRSEPKKSSVRLQQIFEKKTNKLYLRATHTLEQSTGLSMKKVSHSDNSHSDDFSECDQELDRYILLLLGLQRLLSSERLLMGKIIPPSCHAEVFSKLAFNSIELIVKDAEAITARIARCISRKEWTSALSIFSALKRMMFLQSDIERTYDTEQRELIMNVLSKLQGTGAKALEYFLEVIKNESSINIVGMSTGTLGYANVPKDATVHELTSNTIWFIENLGNHSDSIGIILQNDVLYSMQLDTIMMKKSVPKEHKNRTLLSIYIKKALAELNLSIMNKCEQYSDQATKHLFRLNNINYILKSLQRSNLLEILELSEPNAEQSYLDMIRELKFSYQKTWSKILAHIAPLDELPKIVNGKIKDKDRSVLKERFSAFNKDFEDSCKVQRGISIPDVLLREGIKRDNVEYILPKYNRFYDMYSSVQFSKNLDKYIKYKPHEINAMLAKCFDDSA